ncbi:MAG: RagB/SusD family nutrient uptake outer membrane protein [Chitinophagaceae bacterium]
MYNSMMFFKKKKIRQALAVTVFFNLFLLSACKKYLDVVPDNVATISTIFSMRANAEKYLFTCYSWLPNFPRIVGDKPDPAFLAGDELWGVYGVNTQPGWHIALGEQNVVDPLLNFWGGLEGGNALYQGIRDCNIFLENIASVPDLTEEERNRWIGEVTFLKAYYHFFLIRMYGPIVIADRAIDIDESTDVVRQAREPLDSCFNYVTHLLDTATQLLPTKIEDEASELGRVTSTIALGVKAYVLTWQASPLFNGNSDLVSLVSGDGTLLVNQTTDKEKWAKALHACDTAISAALAQGIALYQYVPDAQRATISDTTITQLSIRNAVAERWNSESIWSDPNSQLDQAVITPRTWDPNYDNTAVSARYAAPLHIAELFYTQNGVPIDEDKTWDYDNRYSLKTAGTDDQFNILSGYTTAALNFDRENRFYADLGFDGGIWYGQGKWGDTATYHLEGKYGSYTGVKVYTFYNVTGYWIKKLINYQNTVQTSSYTQTWYPWPVLRLADLYLLYAEASNEYYGPNDNAYYYLNLVRARAGLPTVQESWTNYSTNPTKYLTQDGLREIIHRERNIELAFEGKRYWDLVRWKEAEDQLNVDIQGWNILKSDQSSYYTVTSIYQRTFSQKDYLWPIPESALYQNDKLVQNPGW